MRLLARLRFPGLAILVAAPTSRCVSRSPSATRDRDLRAPRWLCTRRVAVENVRLLFAYTVDMSRYDRPSHRVYMTFFLSEGWYVQFLEADARTPLPRKLTFKDPEKIRELARRGEAWGDSESRQMLESAIENGRGGVYLRLTPDQYKKLRRP
jgi:hypothetical protein